MVFATRITVVILELIRAHDNSTDHTAIVPATHHSYF
ncbi:hypothetical protein OIU74_020154 [Salix koriyanagi]|uniref:Uncharacterized protein n=1 Tax=Salix koriyanagi TaxID=2511006 RepID=A0A9Q0P557_9ROSI|nr:hypothetical protein OIU74_020154 [Salix koriyanagi]